MQQPAKLSSFLDARVRIPVSPQDFLVCGFLFSFSYGKDRDNLPPSPGLLFKECFGSEKAKISVNSLDY
tara:strand:- start:59 stop:265 length:207 start_codon:yes stop_codon:yes gene_type:complete